MNIDLPLLQLAIPYQKIIACILFSFLICFFLTKYYILIVRKMQILSQPIRDDGPESHIKNKKNTPTMGGIFILLSTIATSIFFIDVKNPYALLSIVVFICFGLIGLTDDLMKIFLKNSKGFRGSIKIVIQFLIIAVVIITLEKLNPIHSQHKIFFPIGSGYEITIHNALYVFFVAIVIVGSANALNLTDGLDGLVSIPAIINSICFIAMILVVSNEELSKKFLSYNIENTKELIFLHFSLIGSILAFLMFNFKPAKIFMGDVGSLAIGSLLGLTSIIIKQEFVFFIISLLFTIEAISVILQVSSYKIRKKRIFLMAPIHHHFEKKGWLELKVVYSFWAFAICCSVIGMMIFLF